MDPQKLSSLDPKLREAYQRVMGTPVPQPQVTPVQTQTPTPSAPNPTPEPTPDPTPTPTPIPEPEPTPPPPSEPIPTIQEPPVPQPQPLTPQPEPVSEPQPAISPQPEPPPAGGSTPEPAIPQQPSIAGSNFVQMNSEVPAAQSSPNFSAPASMPQGQTIALKKKSGMIMPILFGIAGLVFIVIYTLFWTKIFNFKLPFLP